MNSLTIIIVNWNSGKLISDCVNSILQSEYNKFILNKIVIVDNASIDDSLDLLPKNDKVLLIKNEFNIGFGAACNIGAKNSESDLILFLNPDTLLYKDSLDDAANFYINNYRKLDFRILGIQLFYENGNIQKSCARFLSLKSIFFDGFGLSKIFNKFGLHMNDFNHNVSVHVDHVIGAFYLIDRKIFEVLNGFDEDFFVYLEDLDLSYRAKRFGYNSYFYSESKVMHIGGGCSEKIKAIRLSYSLFSRIVYIRKHLNRIEGFLATVITLLIEPFFRICYSLLKLDFKGIKETVFGYSLLYRKFLGMKI